MDFDVLVGPPLDLSYEGQVVDASEDIVDGSYTLTNPDYTPFDSVAPNASGFGVGDIVGFLGNDFLERAADLGVDANKDWRYNAPRFLDAAAGALFGWD